MLGKLPDGHLLICVDVGYVSLMQIEKRLNRIVGHDKLNLLRNAIKNELKLEQKRVA